MTFAPKKIIGKVIDSARGEALQFRGKAAIGDNGDQAVRSRLADLGYEVYPKWDCPRFPTPVGRHDHGDR
jgi:hypothetical protein